VQGDGYGKVLSKKRTSHMRGDPIEFEKTSASIKARFLVTQGRNPRKLTRLEKDKQASETEV